LDVSAPLRPALKERGKRHRENAVKGAGLILGAELGRPRVRREPAAGATAAHRKADLTRFGDELPETRDVLVSGGFRVVCHRRDCYFFFELPRFRGTFAPDFLASDSPIAIACFRLVTFLPERPERSVPRLRSCIARLTLLWAFFPYFLPPRFRGTIPP
jgi:hypothetical protein